MVTARLGIWKVEHVLSEYMVAVVCHSTRHSTIAS